MGQIPFGRALGLLAERAPGRPAITCDGRTVTRGELESRTNRLARAYANLGVRQDDLVTIASPNGIGFYESCIAAWKLGATPQPVSPRLPERELRTIVDLADPSLVVGAGDPGRPSVPDGYEPDPDVPDDPLPDRVAASWKAPTSGGSTGRPKIILSGDPSVVDPDAPMFGMQRDGTHVVPGPLCHNGPFLYSMRALLCGNHLAVLRRFDAERTLATIERVRADWILLVPTMMHRIWRLPERERYDVSSLRVVLHLAAPCPAWLKEAWIGWLGAERICELYGATEGQAATWITGTEWLEHRGSVGRPFRGEIRICGEDGVVLGPGDVGEIFLRRTADSAPTYRYIGAEARVVDGWESVGDMGWMDADGYLYIADRRTDLILCGGANVYPAEVEAALDEHPCVRSSAVIGLPDDDLGQVVHAIVETDGDLDPDALRAYLADRIAPYKIPRTYERNAEPLRDEAGKVRRAALREARVTT